MKAYVVCVAKNENHYIKEWSDWYLNIGFDKIVICENNNIDGERISDVVDDDRIEIVDYMNVSGVQPIAYTNEFIRLKDECDWIFFCDCDEFLVLNEKYADVKEFLSDDIFRNADIVRINWKIFSGKTDSFDAVDDYSVMSRFKEYKPDNKQNMYAKSFIRTNIQLIDGTKIYGHGYFDDKSIIAVNDIGKKCSNAWSQSVGKLCNIDYTNAALHHYPTKTIGEFVRFKMKRGGANNNPQRYDGFYYWLKYNERNEEELKYGKELANSIFNSTL